ncbi:MAG: hypothetical protein RR436_05465 [Clostridia bacterium]
MALIKCSECGKEVSDKADNGNSYVDKIIINYSGTNGFGGSTTSYISYHWNKNKKSFEYYCSVSDLQDEKYNKYDDEMVEKMLKNLERISIKNIIEKDEPINKKIDIERINNLFVSGLLKDITLSSFYESVSEGQIL